MADGNSIEILQAGLKATTARSKVIANNVANIDTPNFRRKEVQFEEALADALENPGSDDINDIEPLIIEPRTTPVDGKGNDVNLDAEVGEMVKNSAATKTYLRLMTKLYRQMEYAMKGD